MVALPAGEIELRDDRLNQKWSVAIRPFYISRFQLTQDIYSAVTKSNPSSLIGEKRPVETIAWVEVAAFCNALSALAGLQPAYDFNLSADDALFNPNANGYRLPTEAEWQYACKAGSAETRYGELADIAWYKENSGDKTHPVGEKMPNAWGLYDMLGNVWEWCSDLYDSNVYGTYRIFRGGGWCDEARSVMATTRRRSHPLKFKIDDLGFRLARNNIDQ